MRTNLFLPIPPLLAAALVLLQSQSIKALRLRTEELRATVATEKINKVSDAGPEAPVQYPSEHVELMRMRAKIAELRTIQSLSPTEIQSNAVQVTKEIEIEEKRGEMLSAREAARDQSKKALDRLRTPGLDPARVLQA